MNYLIAFIIAAVAVGCVLIVKGGNRFDDTEEWNDIKDNHRRQRPTAARPATEAEKQRLFDALAKEGKRWNAEKVASQIRDIFKNSKAE